MTLKYFPFIFAPQFINTFHNYHKSMIIIPVKDGETLDKALRKYKKKYERTGVLKEIRNRAYFTKPSVERREEMKKAIRRQVVFANENY